MRKYGKKLLGLLLAASMLVTGSGFSGLKAIAADDDQRNKTNVVTDGKLSDSNLTTEHLSANGIKTKDNGLMRANLSSIDFMTLEGMGLGWNLGNQLEERDLLGRHKTVLDAEQNAGNPVATQKTFDGLKSNGVNTVRVPVAWSNFLTMEIPQADGTVEKITKYKDMYKAIDEGRATKDTYYRVSDELMDRVEEVVNYALNNEMYVIFNIHWDGGWWGMFGAEEWDGTPLTETDIKKNPIRYQAYKKYVDIWTQLSERYKEYSDRLIFEGANEELSGRLNDNFRDPASAQENQTGKLPADGDQVYMMANQINQLFVDIVRNSGGNNMYRQLLIPGSGNESCVIGGYESDKLIINDGTVDERWKLPVDPAEEVTGKKKMSVSVHYYDPTTYGISSSCVTPWGYDYEWGSDQDKKDMEANLNRLQKFTKDGYGIIIGECGCVKANKDGIPDYMKTLFELSMKKGMCPVWWDEGHYFNRTEGYFSYGDIGKVYNEMTGSTPMYVNPDPFTTGVQAPPISENKNPKVVATWEGEFMRHTGDATAEELLAEGRPNFDRELHGIGVTTKEENLTAVIDAAFWNISLRTDWSKIKKPCVKVYPADNHISQITDLQVGYVKNGKDKTTGKEIPKGGFTSDKDYQAKWIGEYLMLEDALLKSTHPWLWITTNNYLGCSYVKIEICDAAYNADGSVFGKPATTKIPTQKITKTVKVKKSVKVKVRSKKTEKATVKVAKKAIASASLKGNDVVIKGKKKGTTVVTVTTKKKIYKITVKVKK